MFISTNYNFQTYHYTHPQKKTSFGSAEEISLQYVLNNHSHFLPLRIKNRATELVKSKQDNISLRDLHLQEYAGLMSKDMTLEKARNMYPEFREVLPYKSAMRKSSVNTRKIAEKTDLDDLPLLLLQMRWGQLKSMEEIAEYFGLKSRSSLAKIIENIRIPEFGKNYLQLTNASDEERNEIIAQKTRAFNDAHRDWVVERNTKLARNPENIELNRTLFADTWERMPEVKADMGAFRADHPDYSDSEFYRGFWAAYPEHRKNMARIRREIAEERRKERNIKKI